LAACRQNEEGSRKSKFGAKRYAKRYSVLFLSSGDRGSDEAQETAQADSSGLRKCGSETIRRSLYIHLAKLMAR